MKHTPRYIEKCRRTERRGHGGDDDGGGAGRERDEVFQKVKDKERLLEGASHVSIERHGKAGRKSSAIRSMPSRRWNQRSSSTKLFSPLSSSNLRREKEREREREREVEAIYFITHICYTSFTAPMHHQLAISACTLTRGRPPPLRPLRR